MLTKANAEVAVTLPSDREIRFTRHFDRPRDLLFEAWTQPEHVRNGWGCDGSSLAPAERGIVMHMADGGDHPFHEI